MTTSGAGHIPDWDSRGLLPPFVSSPTSGEGRSPYLVRLTDLVLRFGYTTARRTFLAGLLDYRADLHAAGIKNGFQWINGSFVEDKIGHSGEEPGDIDLVTFFHVPTGQTQGTLAVAHPDLFHPPALQKADTGLMRILSDARCERLAFLGKQKRILE